MKTCIIASVYSIDPVIYSITQFGAQQVVLVIDEQPNSEQNTAITEIKNKLGKYVDIQTLSTKTYDVSHVAADVVNRIDKIPLGERILLNISAGRKTKALGIMFAGYARNQRIESIFYITKENNSIVYLPKLSYNLTTGQKKVLNLVLDEPSCLSTKNPYLLISMPKSTFYKTLTELRSLGYVSSNKLTEAGRIALL